MGRASIALRAPDGCSGIVDGSVPQTPFCLQEGERDSPLRAAGVGAVLPTSASSTEAHSQQSQPRAQEEVILAQLWFQLSREQQVCFGSCFSRMVLKVLNHTQKEKEVQV
jgi:hypothetical protein